jgi:hypothetical protein
MGVEGYEYCCLGVGADVLRKQNPEVYGTWDGLSFKLAEQEPSGKQYLDVDLNHRLASALGIGDVIQSECVNWNDNLGLSFAEIADALEELW